MELSGKTKMNDLLEKYPFLLDFFIKRLPLFKRLQSTAMRKTVGRGAPMSQVAGVTEVGLELLLTEVADEIGVHTG